MAVELAERRAIALAEARALLATVDLTARRSSRGRGRPAPQEAHGPVAGEPSTAPEAALERGRRAASARADRLSAEAPAEQSAERRRQCLAEQHEAQRARDELRGTDRRGAG